MLESFWYWLQLRSLVLIVTLQMFYMLFLQSYVCQPNSQTTLSIFNSLIPVIKKRQFNAVFTVLQNGFLHVFVCNFCSLYEANSEGNNSIFYRWMYVKDAMKWMQNKETKKPENEWFCITENTFLLLSSLNLTLV